MESSDKHLEQIFNKFALDNDHFLTKTEFKCAFIFYFGLKPSKEDILITKEFINQSSGFQTEAFALYLPQFMQLMKAFSEQIVPPKPFFPVREQMNQQQIDTAWQTLGGQAKGFIDISDFHQHFKKAMPSCFDADLALEMFREVDADKDGKLSYKDFNDCMRFQV